jgi:hypothetical protein
MDKVAIIGTYHFIGFNLCEKLLEEGIEVYGCRFFDDSSEEFMEDKQLLIGRNANFKEVMFKEENEQEELDESTIVIFSFYDLYFSIKEKSFNSFLSYLTRLTNKQSGRRIVILLPLDLLGLLPNEIKSRVNQLKSQNVILQAVYLPTVYGPWQSSFFIFQQYLLRDLGHLPKLDQRENTTDAIYIKDLVEKLLQLIHSPDNNDVVIESGKENQWEKGIEYLQVKELSLDEVKMTPKKINQNIKVITIDSITSIESGLEHQKQHLSKLL